MMDQNKFMARYDLKHRMTEKEYKSYKLVCLKLIDATKKSWLDKPRLSIKVDNPVSSAKFLKGATETICLIIDFIYPYSLADLDKVIEHEALKKLMSLGKVIGGAK